MMMNKSQVYCDACRKSYWLEFSSKVQLSSSGVMRKSLIHHDHVLIIDIDNQGVPRKTYTVPLEYDPMESLIDDVAQGFHYINGEPGKPIIIDFYSSNQQFNSFIKRIFTKIFEHATTNRVDDKFEFNLSTVGKRTAVYSTRLNLSIGPYVRPEFSTVRGSIKGIILHTDEIESKEIDIEEKLAPYDWAAVIVPETKREGYYNILSQYFKDNKMPFFIESLSNQMLKDLFDFIFPIIE